MAVAIASAYIISRGMGSPLSRRRRFWWLLRELGRGWPGQTGRLLATLRERILRFVWRLGRTKPLWLSAFYGTAGLDLWPSRRRIRIFCGRFRWLRAPGTA